MKSKICNGCGMEKLLSEYYREAKNKDGHRGKCKECDNSRIKTYNQNPIVKERKKSYALKYKHTEHGKEVIRKAISKYVKTEKGKTVNKRRRHNRRAIMGNAGTYTTEEWNDRLLEYNHCCAYCYQQFPVEELTIDHMVPLSRGGTNTIDNIVPSCRSCNSSKWTKTPLEMLQKGLM